ncbi:MAG: hypothetical protein E7173_01300 [Firmicutes bacterium]|nr:hypothetical protein [Bacillota bacterium]
MEIKNRNPLIYLISGKARHGKDTIAAIIKDYYESKDKKVITLQYSSYIKEYAKKISNWDGSEETKPRELLQQLGTDVIRTHIDSLFFVDAIIKDIKVYSYFFDVVIVSDIRTPDEIDYPKNTFNNAFSINVRRVNFENGLTDEQKKHYTEIALDNYDKFDYIIMNDGDINNLKNKVETILEGIVHES